MGRTRVRAYLDVVESHPELTPEERQALVDKADEESRKLTEWPEM